MRLLRTLRGVIGTAVSWAVPWACFGGLLAVGFELVAPSLSELVSGPAALWFVFKAGAKLLGLIGLLSGAAFAATLAVTGRRLAFSELTSRRMLVLGAVGATAIAGGLLGLIALATQTWPLVNSVFLGGAALLGSSSAWSMWRLARHADSRSVAGVVGSGRGPAASVGSTRVERATT